MCFQQKQPKPPEVIAPTPPPPVKAPEIAKTSQLQAPSSTKKNEKLKVKYGAKKESGAPKKRDAASLLVPINAPGNNQGGINT
mgnify:CR=1 FL=1|tara:strand:+ start:383 stop:631 length:249 start_codon:yes stop_codon:yes gene_type:complete